MAHTRRGEFHDLDVTNDLKLQGGVTGHLTVRSGANLVMQGAFTGSLSVESDATFTLEGSAEGEVGRNDGIIMLCGQVDWVFEKVPGYVAVAHGSLLTSDAYGTGVLRSDGVIGPVPEGEVNIQVDGVDSYCYFDHDQGCFLPIRGTAD